MCAIFGFVSNPNEPQNGEDLYKLARHLAVEASVRGRDSTGVAVIRQNRRFLDKRAVAPVIYYDKFADRLERLVSEKQFEYFIGHDRFATCASISNRCAHPFWNERYVVVHNGYYYNEEEIKRTFGIDNPTGVDSELILSFVAKFGIARLNLFLEVAEGPSAIAIHDRETQKLFLVRDSNPTSFTHHRGGLVFASTESILVDAIEAAHGVKPDTKSVFSTLPYTLYSCHFDGAKLEREIDWTYLQSIRTTSRGYYGSGYGGYNNYYDGYGYGGYENRRSPKTTTVVESPTKSAKESAKVFTADEDDDNKVIDAELVEELSNEGLLRKCDCCEETMDYLYEGVWYCMVCTLTVDENFDEMFFIDDKGKKVPYNGNDVVSASEEEESEEEESIRYEKSLTKVEVTEGWTYWEDSGGAIVRISSPDELVNNPSEDEVLQFLCIADNEREVELAMEKDDARDARHNIH